MTIGDLRALLRGMRRIDFEAFRAILKREANVSLYYIDTAWGRFSDRGLEAIAGYDDKVASALLAEALRQGGKP